jgi:hypothetical protein
MNLVKKKSLSQKTVNKKLDEHFERQQSGHCDDAIDSGKEAGKAG